MAQPLYFHSSPLLTQQIWGKQFTTTPSFLSSVENYEGFYCKYCSGADDPMYYQPYSDVVVHIGWGVHRGYVDADPPQDSLTPALIFANLIRKCTSCGHQEQISQRVENDHPRFWKFTNYLWSRNRCSTIEKVYDEKTLQAKMDWWQDSANQTCFCGGCRRRTVPAKVDAGCSFNPIHYGDTSFPTCTPCSCDRRSSGMVNGLDFGYYDCMECSFYSCVNCGGCFMCTFDLIRSEEDLDRIFSDLDLGLTCFESLDPSDSE